MEDSEEEEREENESEEFNVIPPYSEKDSNAESEARGSKQGAASRAVPVLLLLLLPTLVLDCWSYWSLHLILRSYFTLTSPFKSIAAMWMNYKGHLLGRYAPFFFSSLFQFLKMPCLYVAIQCALSLPPQELKDISSPAVSARSLLWSSTVKRSEQREQIYECMGEFRNAVWANTLSRACFTLKVHPLF